MSATIFCTFEHQDTADLAMGKIRQIRGVKSINYVVGYNWNHRPLSSGTALGPQGSVINSVYGAVMPLSPTGVRISCEQSACKKVEALLVNMRASGIISMP